MHTLKPVKILFLITIIFIPLSLYAQFVTDYEIKLIGNNTEIIVTKELPSLYYFELIYKDNTVKTYDHKSMIQNGLKTIFANCDQIKSSKLKAHDKYERYLQEIPIPLCCDKIEPGKEKWRFLARSITGVKNVKLIHGWEPINEEFIFGKEPSTEFEEFKNNLLGLIGLSQLNLRSHKSNEIATFAESLSFIENIEGKTTALIDLYYNEDYFKQMMSKGQDNILRIILLHELGHFVASQFSGREAELEADYFSGRWMNIHFSDEITREELHQIANDLFENQPINDYYPIASERTEKFILGWDDAQRVANRNNEKLLQAMEEIRKGSAEYIRLHGLNRLDSLLSVSGFENSEIQEIYQLKYEILTNLLDQETDESLRYEFYTNAISALYGRKLFGKENEIKFAFDILKIEHKYSGKIPPTGEVLLTRILESDELDNYQKAQIHYLIGLRSFSSNDSDRLILAKKHFETSIELDNSNSLPYFYLGNALYEADQNSNWEEAINLLLKYSEVNKINPSGELKKNYFLSSLSKIYKTGLDIYFKNNDFLAYTELMDSFVENSLTLNEELNYNRVIANLKLKNYDRTILALDFLFGPRSQTQELKDLAKITLESIEESDSQLKTRFANKLIDKGLIVSD